MAHGVSSLKGCERRLTCSLRIPPNPIADNLTRQETTEQDASEVGADGPDLSYPDSSVVAEINSFEVTEREES
jgi:hypothetical protein